MDTFINKNIFTGLYSPLLRQQRLLILTGVLFFIFSVNAQSSGNPLKVEDFLNNAFSFEPTIGNFKVEYGRKVKVKTEPVQNFHNKLQVDTIYHLSIRRSSFDIYKTDEKEIFSGAEVKNRLITLNGSIRIGLKRDVLFSKFADLPYSDEDTINLTDKHQFVTCKLVFRRNRLRQINIQYNID